MKPLAILFFTSLREEKKKTQEFITFHVPENKGFALLAASVRICRRGEARLRLIREERLWAERRGTLFDPYLKWHGRRHCLIGLILSISFYFSICSGPALWDMQTPALQVYLEPLQVLNRLSAICALQPAILYLSVSDHVVSPRLSAPPPFLVSCYKIRNTIQHQS